jgi:hypothetical protein
LVPQDIRERKGAFFTPRKWVELSQKYLTDYLGENWQDDYYIWDCAAGTGNLLAGLTNKYNIYASTLDQADVSVVHERIDHGAHLLKNHVFQFDFLNDDFSKLPQSLQDIINDEEKRKKLVIYINPPYAEHLDIKNTTGINSKIISKSGLKFTNIDKQYSEKYGSKASRELFVQFYIRIYEEIPNSIIGSFSKLKYLNSSNFIQFRKIFKAKYESGFMCPANSFDNVKGNFPIGFILWNTNIPNSINSINIDVYSSSTDFINQKLIFIPSGIKGRSSMNDWIKKNEFQNSKYFLGHLNCSSQDFLHQNYTGISIKKQNSAYKQLIINENNIFSVGVYFSVTFSIKATWINDRDQFLYPTDGWESDMEFQNDCLVYSLFDGQNRITSSEGTNHWIPFTEQEVNAQAKFESAFMTDFMKGKIKPEVQNEDLFSNACQPELVSGSPEMLKQVQHDKNKQVQHDKALVFSPEATAVFNAGRELWTYYHTHPSTSSGYATSSGYVESKPYNVNASLYDIREHFQGRNDKGRMNSKSNDARYMELISELRSKLAVLADKIKPKVYEYGFLKE